MFDLLLSHVTEDLTRRLVINSPCRTLGNSLEVSPHLFRNAFANFLLLCIMAVLANRRRAVNVIFVFPINVNTQNSLVWIRKIVLCANPTAPAVEPDVMNRWSAMQKYRWPRATTPPVPHSILAFPNLHSTQHSHSIIHHLHSPRAVQIRMEQAIIYISMFSVLQLSGLTSRY